VSDKPEYKPGDVVNGWRLTERDGWVPVRVRRWDSTSKIIMVGVAAFIVLMIVIGAISDTSDGRSGGHQVRADLASSARSRVTSARPASLRRCGEGILI
jgi:hypothetical protein